MRNLLCQWRVDIVYLQETKLEFISRGDIDVAVIGAAGGILLMWDKRVVTRLDMEVGEFVAACTFKNVVDGFEWAFAGVYGPNGNCDKWLL